MEAQLYSFESDVTTLADDLECEESPHQLVGEEALRAEAALEYAAAEALEAELSVVAEDESSESGSGAAETESRRSASNSSEGDGDNEAYAWSPPNVAVDEGFSAASMFDEIEEADEQDAMLHARLVAFFTDVKPSEVKRVPALIAKYKGKEAAMLRALARKFGKPVPAAVDAIPGHRNSVALRKLPNVALTVNRARRSLLSKLTKGKFGEGKHREALRASLKLPPPSVVSTKEVLAREESLRLLEAESAEEGRLRAVAAAAAEAAAVEAASAAAAEKAAAKKRERGAFWADAIAAGAHDGVVDDEESEAMDGLADFDDLYGTGDTPLNQSILGHTTKQSPTALTAARAVLSPSPTEGESMLERQRSKLVEQIVAVKDGGALVVSGAAIGRAHV
jgi:hypothetical protein